MSDELSDERLRREERNLAPAACLPAAGRRLIK
jgi:hypothetical protein